MALVGGHRFSLDWLSWIRVDSRLFAYQKDRVMYAKIVYNSPKFSALFPRGRIVEVDITEWSYLEISFRGGVAGISADKAEYFQCALDRLIRIDFDNTK